MLIAVMTSAIGSPWAAVRVVLWRTRRSLADVLH
jgi:hypothetical protein